MGTKAVRLSPAWPAAFRRSVRRPIEKDGKVVAWDVVKTLVFDHKKVLHLDEEEFAAVKADIGNSLELVHVDEDEPAEAVTGEGGEPGETLEAMPRRKRGKE